MCTPLLPLCAAPVPLCAAPLPLCQAAAEAKKQGDALRRQREREEEVERALRKELVQVWKPG